jgi:hypothetical protein
MASRPVRAPIGTCISKLSTKAPERIEAQGVRTHPQAAGAVQCLPALLFDRFYPDRRNVGAACGLKQPGRWHVEGHLEDVLCQIDCSGSSIYLGPFPLRTLTPIPYRSWHYKAEGVHPITAGSRGGNLEES